MEHDTGRWGKQTSKWNGMYYCENDNVKRFIKFMTIKLPMIIFPGTVKTLLQVYMLYKLWNYKALTVQRKPRQIEQSLSHPSCDFRRHCRPTGTTTSWQWQKINTWSNKSSRSRAIQPAVTNWISPKLQVTQ